MKKLFALLRLGLETVTIDKENLSDFIMLSEQNWDLLGRLARKQGVLGILLDGIENLDATPYGATRELNAEQ